MAHKIDTQNDTQNDIKGIPNLDSDKMHILQDLELEMISDMYNRMTSACHRKCIPPKYKEALLAKGEAVCIDRCIAKYLEIHDRVGKKLTEMSVQDDDLMKKLQAEQLNTNTD